VSINTWLDAIRSFIHTRWDVVGDGSELVPENVNFKPTQGQKFVAYQVRPIETVWVTPGFSDTLGAVVFTAYAPVGRGPEAAEDLLELAVSTVRRQKTGDVQFEEASVEAIGPDDQGRFLVNGRVPFFYQESVS
jgi:hypothetical protein